MQENFLKKQNLLPVIPIFKNGLTKTGRLQLDNVIVTSKLEKLCRKLQSIHS